MKKGIRIYVLICAAVILAACLLIHGIALLSVGILDRLDEKYLSYYKENRKGVSAPWYRDGLHIVDEGFIRELEEKSPQKADVIAIGSSMTIMPFNPKKAEDNGYAYRFLVCGNGCWKSDRQLYELYREAGCENEDDIIKLEVSFSTFRDMETTITQTILDKWDKYSVFGEERIRQEPGWLSPVYALNLDLMRIQNLWEIGKDMAFGDEDPFGSGERIPGNFLNNYFSYEAVAESCNMTADMKEYMKDLMEDISSDHRLVVELSPLPAGLAATDFGQQLTAYMDEELIPCLEERGIPYFDYRYDYRDSEYCDGVHLGYEASLRYTGKLRKDMNGVMDDAG